MHVFHLMLAVLAWEQPCESEFLRSFFNDREGLRNATKFYDKTHDSIIAGFDVFGKFAKNRRKKRGTNEGGSRATSDADQKCQKEGVHSTLVCDPTLGGVCRNRTCVTSCDGKHLKKCNCPDQDDNYCYLCCGNSTSTCKPAHNYDIYQPNGELWERASCTRCRNRATDGLSCDDRDKKRVCHSGKCASNACLGRPEGVYCDARKSKVCADSQCQDPCSAHRSDLLTCECDLYSDHRCELCCFDPLRKRCEGAFRKYGIQSSHRRPIARSGIGCRYGPKCNFFAVCSGSLTLPGTVQNLISTAFVFLHVKKLFF